MQGIADQQGVAVQRAGVARPRHPHPEIVVAARVFRTAVGTGQEEYGGRRTGVKTDRTENGNNIVERPGQSGP